MAPDPATTPNRKRSCTLVLSAAAVTAITVTALGIGYTAGRAEPGTEAKSVEMTGKTGNNPHPEITRDSGLSRVKAETAGGAVRIRPCPGPAPYGSPDCPESSITYVPDGTLVQMWCWTDSMNAPEGYPADRKRWFYVYQPTDTPDTRPEGYLYSAFIPTSEQITTRECTTQILLELRPLPPAPPDPTSEDTVGPAPTHAPTTPAPASPPPPPPTTPAPEPEPSTPPAPEPTKAPDPRPVREQTGQHGSGTFRDPHGAKGPGERIPAHTWVDVECRTHGSGVASVRGWWYRISSSPWTSQYYAPSMNFMNGDEPGQTPPTDTDFSVPVC
ncbi:hypothetical protein R2B67_35860 [Streptomyces cyaneofuscatus]|uniref:hypothetical protein n=1 Tax=Streptomyces cyaneofuscatus TaxID=66883 RepID=UPI0029549173|nr:hypothetical protein [Streptomyces cyaneofuscatus]WOP13590.1 hypothetical protein R2B67_35860 [Streptomyces cyaneofuscatus]